MPTVPSSSGSVNFAGSTITGNYNPNGLLELTYRLPSGRVVGPVDVLSTSYINSLGLDSTDLASFKSIQTSYFDITGQISNQIQEDQTTPPAATAEPAPATTDTPTLENPPVAPDPEQIDPNAVNPADFGAEDPEVVDEFDGIDAQVAANENALEEPPLLSDDEVDQYLQQGGEIDITAPLEEPPTDEEADEFDGIDQQIAANENALEEPPVLSDEEVDNYLQNGGEQEDPATFDNFGTDVADDETDTNVTGAVNETRTGATEGDATSSEQRIDWRVRLRLAPEANYLYNAPENAGILAPLQATDGVIFPYTPSINISYVAGYDTTELIHSNYKIYQYKSSSVDSVQITGDFTAQDTNEANYLLAVIHFFKSVTKMFYGRDENPRNGTPPPLCYLTGLGTYQFDEHPLVITNFSYQMPTDVDYIRATSFTNEPGNNTSQQGNSSGSQSASNNRLNSSGLKVKTPNFQNQKFLINRESTYVPTKMQISITALPIVSRNDISNVFSLKDYATGALLRGSQRGGKVGGIW